MAAAAMRKYTDVVPPAPLEPDRHEWKPGEVIAITGIVITTETKFGKLAKINGIDPKTQQFIKRRTTSEPVIKKLENLLQAAGKPDGAIIGDPVYCKLIQKTSGNKLPYFDLADPGT